MYMRASRAFQAGKRKARDGFQKRKTSGGEIPICLATRNGCGA